jgi:hypothetical protein
MLYNVAGLPHIRGLCRNKIAHAPLYRLSMVYKFRCSFLTAIVDKALHQNTPWQYNIPTNFQDYKSYKLIIMPILLPHKVPSNDTRK